MNSFRRSLFSRRLPARNLGARTTISSSSRAFTLIELLTVIAIIGILAAIIIPVVGKVRETASKATFSSNLRQVGVGLRLFAADNRDRFPGIRNSNSSFQLLGGQMPYRQDNINERSALQGPAHLGPYLGSHKVTVNGINYWYTPQLDSPKLRSQYPLEEAVGLKCLSLDQAPSVDGTAANIIRPFGLGTTNAMTMADISSKLPMSRRWMLRDYAPNAASPNDSSKPVHGSSFVALFYDGHVDSVPAEKMGGNGLIK